MDLISRALHETPNLTLEDVALLSETKTLCKDLHAAANEWLKVSHFEIRHIELASRFARAITSAEPLDCLRALITHHETYGGGVHWFRLRDDRIEPLMRPKTTSSRYGFRLWSLCRLAVQCGVIKAMPTVLDERSEENEDSEEDTTNE